MDSTEERYVDSLFRIAQRCRQNAQAILLGLKDLRLHKEWERLGQDVMAWQLILAIEIEVYGTMTQAKSYSRPAVQNHAQAPSAGQGRPERLLCFWQDAEIWLKSTHAISLSGSGGTLPTSARRSR